MEGETARFLLRCALLFALARALYSSPEPLRRVCYFTNWSCDLLVEEAYFCLHDIDLELCSHIIYAFVGINVTSLSLSPSRIDDESVGDLKGRFVIFNELKRKTSNLKTLLSVGGSQQSEQFQTVTSSPASRRTFAYNTALYVRRWGFDGLDLDWEYPGSDQREALTLLVTDLKLAFEQEAKESGKEELMLSLAAPASEEKVRAGYQVDKVSRHVDMINLMAYDFYGGWGKITGFHSPLYPRATDTRFSDKLCVEFIVQLWLDLGAPPGKINLGIAGYGQSFTLPSTSQNVLEAGNSTMSRNSTEGGPYNDDVIVRNISSHTQNIDVNHNSSLDLVSENSSGKGQKQPNSRNKLFGKKNMEADTSVQGKGCPTKNSISKGCITEDPVSLHKRSATSKDLFHNLKKANDLNSVTDKGDRKQAQRPQEVPRATEESFPDSFTTSSVLQSNGSRTGRPENHSLIDEDIPRLKERWDCTMYNDTAPALYKVGTKAIGPGTPGRLRHLDGQLSYPEICEMLARGGTLLWDQEQRVPYATLRDQWVGFDDPRSIAEKVRWAMEKNLGGIMFWSLDLDDFRGDYCGQGRYPLLSSITETVASLYNTTVGNDTVILKAGEENDGNSSTAIPNRPTVGNRTKFDCGSRHTNSEVSQEKIQPENFENNFSGPSSPKLSNDTTDVVSEITFSHNLISNTNSSFPDFDTSLGVADLSMGDTRQNDADRSILLQAITSELESHDVRGSAVSGDATTSSFQGNVTQSSKLSDVSSFNTSDHTTSSDFLDTTPTPQKSGDVMMKVYPTDRTDISLTNEITQPGSNSAPGETGPVFPTPTYVDLFNYDVGSDEIYDFNFYYIAFKAGSLLPTTTAKPTSSPSGHQRSQGQKDDRQTPTTVGSKDPRKPNAAANILTNVCMYLGIITCFIQLILTL